MRVRIVAHWTDEYGTTRHISHGQLEDMSDSGLGVRVNYPISVGAKLNVRTPFGNFLGTVVRSSRQGRDYRLGIKRDVAKPAKDR